MKKTRIAAILALVLIIPAMLGGCAAKGAGNPEPKKAPGMDAGPANAEPESDALECNWLLKVDQTIPVTDGDLTVNHTLVLIAQKEGGKGVYGTYEGAAYIGSHLDASNLSNAFIQIAGGFDVNVFANNLSFEVEPFDLNRYTTYGSQDDVSLPPLVEYGSMALLSPEMEGGVVIDPTFQAIDGLKGGYFDAGGGTAPVAMKIAIRSGKVHVEIPAMIPNVTFEGTVIGDPQRSDEEYRRVMEKIQELKQQDADTTNQESEDSTMQENLGILNQIPWPGELVPNLPKASDFVYKVYDWREEDGNIEIQIYMSQEEAEFYFSELKDLGISPAVPTPAPGISNWMAKAMDLISCAPISQRSSI